MRLGGRYIVNPQTGEAERVEWTKTQQELANPAAEAPAAPQPDEEMSHGAQVQEKSSTR